jgi:hypothetical protein
MDSLTPHHHHSQCRRLVASLVKISAFVSLGWVPGWWEGVSISSWGAF